MSRNFKGIRVWEHNLCNEKQNGQKVSMRYRQQGCFVKSSREYLDFLRQHDSMIKDLRKDIRNTNDDEERRKLKSFLSTVMFGCYNTAMDQGWGNDCLGRQTMNVVIDVDHFNITEDVRTRVCNHPLTLYVDISASGDGMHIVIKRKYRDYVACQKEFCQELGLPYDPSCKNPNRLLYVAPEEDVLLIKDALFDPVEEGALEQLPFTSAGSGREVGEPRAEVQENSDWKVQLIDALFQQIGKPKAGVNNQRHSKSLQVARWYFDAMRHLRKKATLSETVGIFREHFNFGCPDNIEQCVRYAYKQDPSPYIPMAVRNVLGLDKVPALLAEDEAEYWAQRLESIHLPWQWKTLIDSLPRHKRIAGFISMLPAWATMGSGISYMDCHKHIVRHTNFNVWLVAQQGTGKQEVFDLAEMVIRPLLDRERAFHQARDEFNEMMELGGGKAEKGMKQPKNPILTGDITFSTNELARTLRNVRRRVMDYYGIEHDVQDKVYLRTSEGSYALTQLNKGFNDFAQWMLLSYGQENKECKFKERTMVSGPVPAAIEWLVLTNRNPFFEFLKRMGISHGFPTRVLIASFPYIDSTTDKEAQEKLRKKLPLIQQDAMRLHDMAVNVGEHWQTLNDKLKQIKAEAGSDTVRADSAHRPYNETGPMAGALSAALRSLNAYKEEGKIYVTDDDIAVAMLVADFQYSQFMKLMYRLIVAENEKGNSLERPYARPAIDVPANSSDVSTQRLAALPQTFTTTEGMTLTGHGPAKRFRRWCTDQANKGHLLRTGENEWQKI